jgi:uncharacterized membrane protein YkvA (DUF1232 family)
MKLNKEQMRVSIVQPAKEYVDEFDREDGKLLINKIAKAGKKIGINIIFGAMILYYSLQDEGVPTWAKTILAGAISYFIIPFDILPDFIPGGGFTDDWGVILLAISQVAIFVTPETKHKAREKMEAWFDLDEEALMAVEEALFRSADAAKAKVSDDAPDVVHVETAPTEANPEPFEGRTSQTPPA